MTCIALRKTERFVPTKKRTFENAACFCVVSHLAQKHSGLVDWAISCTYKLSTFAR